MEQAQHFLTHFSGVTGYVFFYFLIMACGCGLPVNSDICLITSAVLASQGVFNLRVLMVLAFFALLSGDSITFFAGRKWGMDLIKKKPLKWLFPQKQVLKAQHYLTTYGSRYVFFIRFLPLIRSILFFTSGTLKIKPSTFYLLDASATLIYLPSIMLSSYYASENIDQIISMIKRSQFFALGIFVFVCLFLYFKPKKRKAAVR